MRARDRAQLRRRVAARLADLTRGAPRRLDASQPNVEELTAARGRLGPSAPVGVEGGVVRGVAVEHVARVRRAHARREHGVTPRVERLARVRGVLGVRRRLVAAGLRLRRERYAPSHFGVSLFRAVERRSLLEQRGARRCLLRAARQHLRRKTGARGRTSPNNAERRDTSRASATASVCARGGAHSAGAGRNAPGRASTLGARQTTLACRRPRRARRAWSAAPAPAAPRCLAHHVPSRVVVKRALAVRQAVRRDAAAQMRARARRVLKHGETRDRAFSQTRRRSRVRAERHHATPVARLRTPPEHIVRCRRGVSAPPRAARRSVVVFFGCRPDACRRVRRLGCSHRRLRGGFVVARRSASAASAAAAARFSADAFGGVRAAGRRAAALCDGCDARRVANDARATGSEGQARQLPPAPSRRRRLPASQRDGRAEPTSPQPPRLCLRARRRGRGVAAADATPPARRGRRVRLWCFDADKQPLLLGRIAPAAHAAHAVARARPRGAPRRIRHHHARRAAVRRPARVPVRASRRARGRGPPPRRRAHRCASNAKPSRRRVLRTRRGLQPRADSRLARGVAGHLPRPIVVSLRARKAPARIAPRSTDAALAVARASSSASDGDWGRTRSRVAAALPGPPPPQRPPGPPRKDRRVRGAGAAAGSVGVLRGPPRSPRVRGRRVVARRTRRPPSGAPEGVRRPRRRASPFECRLGLGGSLARRAHQARRPPRLVPRFADSGCAARVPWPWRGAPACTRVRLAGCPATLWMHPRRSLR